MSPKSRARRPAREAEVDALSRQQEGNTAPSDVEALAALRVLRAWLGVGATPSVYTQHDLPPDVTSADAYQRRHRELRKAKVEGVWVRGKTLACTPAAWATELPRSKRDAKPDKAPEQPEDLDAKVARAFGIKPRRAAG